MKLYPLTKDKDFQELFHKGELTLIVFGKILGYSVKQDATKCNVEPCILHPLVQNTSEIYSSKENDSTTKLHSICKLTFRYRLVDMYSNIEVATIVH